MRGTSGGNTQDWCWKDVSILIPCWLWAKCMRQVRALFGSNRHVHLGLVSMGLLLSGTELHLQAVYADTGTFQLCSECCSPEHRTLLLNQAPIRTDQAHVQAAELYRARRWLITSPGWQQRLGCQLPRPSWPSGCPRVFDRLATRGACSKVLPWKS